jgi:hypothetical protein
MTGDQFPAGTITFLFTTELTPTRRQPSLLFNGYRDLFLGRKATVNRCMKLTNHVHLVPMLRMYGAIPPVPHASSWRGVLLRVRKILSVPSRVVERLREEMLRILNWKIRGSKASWPNLRQCHTICLNTEENHQHLTSEFLRVVAHKNAYRHRVNLTVITKLLEEHTAFMFRVAWYDDPKLLLYLQY